jgi:hypothetical protein
MACDESLTTCILALAGALGALVAAFVALTKANAAHRRIDGQRETEENQK